MTKIDSLRRFLLPCISPTTTSSSTTTASRTANKVAAAGEAAPTTNAAVSKKRLSASLRGDYSTQLHQQDHCSSTTTDESVKNYHSSSTSISSAPPRASKSMVIGTFYGHRRGHLCFSVQHDRLNPKPLFLLQFSIPTHLLVKEMQAGLVRIVLECDGGSVGVHSCPLHSVPMWKMCVNGRKVGFAARRKTSHKDRLILKTMQSTTVGAGVIPAGTLNACSYSSSRSCDNCDDHQEYQEPGARNDDDDEDDEGELIYMRANYERVIGNADSEAFHLINPDACPGQELSIFLLRNR